MFFKKLHLALIINLFGLTINAMEIDPQKMIELTHESADFQALLASVNNNPTAAYLKILMNELLRKNEKKTILNKLQFYGADKDVAKLLNDNVTECVDINKAFLYTASVFPMYLQAIGELIQDVNIEITGYCPVLIEAIMNNADLSIVKFLLDRGANINAQDETGFTALMEATIYNKEEIIKLLVESGADISIINENKHTAIDLAEQEGYEDLAGYLKTVLIKQNQSKNIYLYFVNTMLKTKQNQKHKQTQTNS